MGTGPVQTTPPEASAFDILKQLDASRISGMAVCNPQGRIVGNFSISEMRTFVADHFGALALPVGEFLALEHGTEYAGYGIHNTGDSAQISASVGGVFARERDGRRRVSIAGGEVGQQILLVSEGNTLREVMEIIVEQRIHRLYVADEDGKPVKVITMTDILSFLVDLCDEEDGTGSGAAATKSG